MDIYNYLTQQQILDVKERINSGCLFFQKNYVKRDNPFSCMRRKHCLTAEVLYEFAPNQLISTSEFRSDIIHYGLQNKMTQPEISTDKAIFHIYSDGADLKNAVIKDRCMKYNTNLEAPIFFVFRFCVDKNYQLLSVEAVFFDNDANVSDKTVVYKRTKVVNMAG